MESLLICMNCDQIFNHLTKYIRQLKKTWLFRSTLFRNVYFASRIAPINAKT